MPKTYRRTGNEKQIDNGYGTPRFTREIEVEPTYREQGDDETFGAWIEDVVPEYWKELDEDGFDSPLGRGTWKNARTTAQERWEDPGDTTDIADLVRERFRTKAVPNEPIKGLGRRQINATGYPESTTELGRRRFYSDTGRIMDFLNAFEKEQ